jgi:pilus assembly protein CpaE
MGSADRIRVVIVDDIAETRENIRKLLQFENDVEVVGTARTGREGIEVAKDTKPDVIIMDINMPDMDGIAATETIRRALPFTQIVILSVQGDPNYMRSAMLAGARDFLTKPPTVDELTSAVRRAGKMAIEEREKAPAQTQLLGGSAGRGLAGVSLGKVITIYSPKGGVGCTTIATNIGMTLHNAETPAVLVDGKLQYGDIAVFLNVQAKNSVADLAPRADELDPDIVEEVLLIHDASGIRVLAAPSRPENAENITGDQFAKVLQYLKKIYSYVIVDCASSLDDVVLGVLDSSDIIVLLTTQEIPSIKNARSFLEISDVLNIERNRILFVMNRFDKRIGITPEKISESFKQEIVAVLPTDERLVIPSINRGVPFMLGDKSRALAKAYLSLAEVIRQRLLKLSEMEGEKTPPISSAFRHLSK